MEIITILILPRSTSKQLFSIRAITHFRKREREKNLIGDEMVPDWRALVIFKAAGTALLMAQTKGWTAHLDKHLRVYKVLLSFPRNAL